MVPYLIDSGKKVRESFWPHSMRSFFGGEACFTSFPMLSKNWTFSDVWTETANWLTQKWGNPLRWLVSYFFFVDMSSFVIVSWHGQMVNGHTNNHTYRSVKRKISAFKIRIRKDNQIDQLLLCIKIISNIEK